MTIKASCHQHIETEYTILLLEIILNTVYFYVKIYFRKSNDKSIIKIILFFK